MSKAIEQTMENLPHGTRRLAAQLRTSVGFENLWRVLTDYDRLSEFIPNLAESKVISRNGNKVELAQVGSQDFLGFSFSAEVLLEFEEEPSKGRLKFHLLEGDFRRFDGSWILQELPNGNGSSLIYELTVQGCFGMPISLIEQRLRRDLTINLIAVENAALNYRNAH